MSRIRKLSEGADLPLSRLKHRQSSKSINTTSKKLTKLGSPYSKVKLIARSPSYLLAQPVNNQSKVNLSVRSKSKNSFRLDDSSLSAARLNTPWENLAIHARLLKEKFKLLENEKKEDFSEKIFDFFDEVIEKDLLFGSLLSKIKVIIVDSLKEALESVKDCKKQIFCLEDEKQSFKKMLDRLSTENMDLGKEIQRLEGICSGLQGTLDEIRKVSLETVPIDSDKWRALLYENSQYVSLVQDMKLDIKEYQYKEDQLIRLIGAIKSRGVPVDDIYDEEVKTDLSNSRLSMSSEFISPSRVPLLDLSQILTSTDGMIH
jgi:hypothetical protein